ncbi:uncharacterized protein LOC131065711 isoform X2 [Cryptomeria japonica]|uniref:uncharacterized protein LOC131065711 isoform X2 n=1 Tax=Cryptomeria japonica TaxID=3369 RepID=UPI0027D9E3B5|nr:uncharacterized protein LOC131065711 isoform X2 [Cryptomeria japonica]
MLSVGDLDCLLCYAAVLEMVLMLFVQLYLACHIYLYLVYDLAEVDRASHIETFRRITLEWLLKNGVEAKEYEENIKGQNSYMLVMTDSCLPMQALGEAPFSAKILINYDLPTKKEAYMRRLAACMAGTHFPSTNKLIGVTIPTLTTSSTSTINPSHGAIVINMVVGGEVVSLKNIEEGCGLVIEEMPIHISELL